MGAQGPIQRDVIQLAIISDVHYAGPLERTRLDHQLRPIQNPLRRWMVRQYRRHIWLKDPFAHNHLLDRFLQQTGDVDLALANGDYSCDSAHIGVCDDAAMESALECLTKLRRVFGDRFRATIGDHEIGKRMFASTEGSLRLASYRRSLYELGLAPLWTHEFGEYLLLGITSSLPTFPLFEAEALPEERADWQHLRSEHLADIARILQRVRPSQKILLFCHDPSALPFLWRHEAVRAKLPQIERTIIGHLHSNLIFHQARRLAGMPRIRFLGHTPARLSAALREARHWLPFKPLLCPSPSGLQLLKDGGYYRVTIDPSALLPAQFEFHPLAW